MSAVLDTIQTPPPVPLGDAAPSTVSPVRLKKDLVQSRLPDADLGNLDSGLVEVADYSGKQPPAIGDGYRDFNGNRVDAWRVVYVAREDFGRAAQGVAVVQSHRQELTAYSGL